MQLGNQKSEIKNGNWLPDMDLNHDKVIQSHLCYRYTIGQAGASGKLKSFAVQSRRQERRALSIYVYPHPCPLPRGGGERAPALLGGQSARRGNAPLRELAKGHAVNGLCRPFGTWVVYDFYPRLK